MMEKNNMNIKKMVAPIVAIMMVAAIFVTMAAAFTAPNANDDRVEFEYSEGNCDGLYMNERWCPQERLVPTLRIYGEDSYDAAFPYTDPEAPFDPTSSEAPGKDFVIGNPAYITETAYGDDDLIQVDGADGREKIFIKQWYVPEYPEPRGDVWVGQDTVYSADIVTEYSYMLLDSHNMPTAAKQANFWFPIGSRGGQIGLDSFDLTTGGWVVGDPTMVALNDVGDYNSDGLKDMTIEARDPVRLYDDGQWIEFLDHRIYVTDVAQVAGGNWAATINVYYIGNRNSQQLINSNVDVVVGAGQMAFGRHSYHPNYDLCFERPWYIEAVSHTQEFVNGTSVHSVKVRVGRRLHTKETFFVDGAEYDVAMIYGPETASDQFTTFKYITIRNPTPKCLKGQGDITLDALSVTKTCVPRCEVLPVLPPFNFCDHTMIDDIHLPACYTDCENEPCDIFMDDPTSILDRDFVVGPLEIMWVEEDIEPRFHTNLLEILKEPQEIWQWIHIHIMPDAYTEMCYPELPDAAVCSPPTTWHGDFLLVSSWEAPNSCGDRMKFAYDATDSTDIYVNEQEDDDWGAENVCGNNSVRIYGEGDKDAAFPYVDPEGPFNKLSADAPRKDFVTFNPAFISEAEYGVDDQIVVNSYDGAEKVFVRQWYVPEYKEPKGLTWVTQDPLKYTADIVTEYTYMLLYASSNLPAPCTPVGTNFWFPIGSRDGQIGLDSFDLTTEDWIIPVEDPTIVALKDVADYNGDGRKDITIETRDAVRLFDTGLGADDEWIEFLDHRIYVKDVSQVAGGWAATVDVYYIGNDGEQQVNSDVDVVVGETKAFGRHSYHPHYDLCFERPWYITAVSHTVEAVGGTTYDSVKVRVGRRLHTEETFFVDGAEYDVAMIYGPETASDQFTTFKYITIRNPTPKYHDVELEDLSIVKESVGKCEVMPILPPFNFDDHKIVDDIGIPHTCPKEGGKLIYGDYIQDEPGTNGRIDKCADTVAERIVVDQDAFVSYFYEELTELRFRTSLLEILDEDTVESWNLLCMWTLPDMYTAMVYPDVGDCACCDRDADFLVTTSGPKGNVSMTPCDTYDTNGTPGIQKDEAVAAINDYLQYQTIDKETAVAVLNCYFGI